MPAWGWAVPWTTDRAGSRETPMDQLNTHSLGTGGGQTDGRCYSIQPPPPRRHHGGMDRWTDGRMLQGEGGAERGRGWDCSRGMVVTHVGYACVHWCVSVCEGTVQARGCVGGSLPGWEVALQPVRPWWGRGLHYPSPPSPASSRQEGATACACTHVLAQAGRVCTCTPRNGGLCACMYVCACMCVGPPQAVHTHGAARACVWVSSRAALWAIGPALLLAPSWGSCYTHWPWGSMQTPPAGSAPCPGSVCPPACSSAHPPPQDPRPGAAPPPIPIGCMYVRVCK